jgi:CheY-like chemotaxis protein
MSEQVDILLVEDDPGDARLALAVLRTVELANRTVVVNDGQEALDFLHSRGRYRDRAPGHPALILLDLKMPRVDGFDLLREIKSQPNLRLIPVVALTSSREARDITRAYRLGVNGYVVKGISFAEFGSRLKALAEYWVKVNERPALRAQTESPPGPETRRDVAGDVAQLFTASPKPLACN